MYELGLGARKILGELQLRFVILSGYSLLSYNVSKYCIKNNIPYLIYTGETSVTAKDFDGNPIRKFLRKRLAVNSAGYIEIVLKNFDLCDKKIPGVDSDPAVLWNTVINHNGDYFAYDLSPDNINATKKRIPNLKAYVGDLAKTNFDDEFFDFVISLGCNEYKRH